VEIEKRLNLEDVYVSSLQCIIYPQSNGKSGENVGKIKEIKTIGRGYNKFKIFRVVILFFCDSLDLYPHDSW